MEARMGIYEIKIIGDRRRYVAATTNIRNRQYVHINHLRNNKHANKYLQKAFNKYGESSYQFDVIDTNIKSEDDMRVKLEQYYSQYPESSLYNKASPIDKQIRYRKGSKLDVEKLDELFRFIRYSCLDVNAEEISQLLD